MTHLDERSLETAAEIPAQREASDLVVIIVNWNTRELLERCLQSLVFTTSVSFRVVVVDNASSDGSAEMVSASFPDVELIHSQENLGYARANNLALLRHGDQARYSLLLNPDTEVRPGTLRTMVEFMDEHPEAGIGGCKVVKPDGKLDWPCKRGYLKPSALFYRALRLDTLFPQSRRFGAYHLTYVDEDEIHEVDSVVGAFMMIRRECLAATGLLEESYFMYGEDIDFCYRAKELGWKVYYVPTGTILHHKGQATGKRSYQMIRCWYDAAWKVYRNRVASGYPFFVNAMVWGGFKTMCASSLAANYLRSEKRLPSRR